MASLNLVHLIGNLGQKPEVKFMPNGDAVVNLSIATSEKWKDKQTGEQKEHTEWHRVTFFGRSAEVIGEYCDKGSSLYVEGRLKTRKYDKDGQTHYATEIQGNRVQFLGSRGGGRSDNDGDSGEVNQSAKQPTPAAKPAQTDFDDDIPF